MPAHIMLDIETAGTRAGAAILTIGACSFGHAGLRKQFYRTANLRSQVEAGFHIDADTMCWWMEQSTEARLAAFGVKDAAPLSAVMFHLLHFCNGARLDASDGDLRVWAYGASFDIPIVEEACRLLKADVPWRYNEHRCARTVIELAGLTMSSFHRGTAHNALDDAMGQADATEVALRILGARSGREAA